jgi:hypothetical protein
VDEKCPIILPIYADFHVTFRDLLHAIKLRHWTDGSTSPPNERVLRIFFALKIRRLRRGTNPRTFVPKASTLPLDHRSRSPDINYLLTYLRTPWSRVLLEKLTSELCS